MVVTLILYFAAIFSYDTAYEKQQLQTAIFNTYVWLQIFNMFKYAFSWVSLFFSYLFMPRSLFCPFIWYRYLFSNVLGAKILPKQ
jgi:hypothetical protein